MGQLFVCYKCHHVDDIELAFTGAFPRVESEQLCTLCKTGTWHDLFEYAPYDAATDLVVNRTNGLGLG